MVREISGKPKIQAQELSIGHWNMQFKAWCDCRLHKRLLMRTAVVIQTYYGSGHTCVELGNIE